MANRVAAVLLFVGIAIAAAAWYASGNAQPATQVLPAEIIVNASQVGSGNWVRYLVNVKNVGDVPFEGDVVLESSGDNGQQSPGSPAAVPPPKLPRSVPRFPAQAPDAAYQAHVKVAPRETRSITITAPDRYNSVAVAQTPDGSLAGQAPVSRSRSTAIALLTDSQPAADELQGLPLDDIGVRAASYTARTFPASSLGLAPYSAVVIDQFDVQSLSTAQRDALRDFVGRGGGLVVAGGPSWRRTLSSLPAELAPLHATGSAQEPLAALAALAGSRAAGVVTTATGELRNGSWPVIKSEDGVPLVADAVYGSGTITVLAFDPAAEIFGTDLARAAWTQAMGQVLPHRTGYTPGAWTMPAITFQDALSFPALRTAALPSPWLVGPLLLLYLVVVAPLNYLFLRRRLRSPDLLWVTAPIIAILFTGGFYWVGAELQGGQQDEQLQVLRLGPNGSVASVDYHRIVFTRRGYHSLATTEAALAAPLTFDLSGSGAQSQGGCGDRCTLALSGLPSGEEHVVPTQHPLAIERGVVYGGVRILGTASVSRQPISVDAHLQSVAGRVTGEIDNTGERPVHGVVLYSVENGVYHRTALASTVAPGARVQVSSQGSVFDGDPDAPVAGSVSPPDPATRISRAVGAELLGEGSQKSWLVGFTDPVTSVLTVDGATPSRNATTVFETPVTVERADGPVSDWATRRLVASAGDRSGGFTDVYDLQLPARLPTSLQVGYDHSQFGAVEIFDWSSGAWHTDGWKDDPNDSTRTLRPLSPSEVLGAAGGSLNLVRLRVKENRIGWGAGLYVLGP